MLFYIASTLALIALIIGSITDMRKREVPDWVNYSLIASGFGFNLLYSVINSDFSFFVNGVAGFLLFLGFALVMYHSGQWGGGDSKLLMGLGALFGVNVVFFKMVYFNIMNLFKPMYPSIYVELPFAINLIVNVLIIGAVYGLLWSFILVLMNRKKFLKEAKKYLEDKKIRKIQRYSLIGFVALLIFSFFIKDILLKITIMALLVLVFLVFYLWIFIKSVENSCMLKYVEPMKLTEGDWIAKEVKVSGKYICGPKDLGIEKKQIKQLIGFYKKGKIKKVLIKEGIPFVPSFLIAFILTLIYGNIVLLLV